LVGRYQIREIQRHNKCVRTLAAIDVYYRDPVIDAACRRIFDAKRTGEFDKDPSAYRLDITTILNYFDGLAVGIEQNLYVEDMLRDHLEGILIEETEDKLSPEAAKRA